MRVQSDILARFLVPLNADDDLQVPGWITPLEVEKRGSHAEILVKGFDAKYLSQRRYALEVEMPKVHLSYSQINMFLRCPRQYFFRYVEGLKAPPSAALVVGSSVHKTAEHNNKQKMFTKEDVSLDTAKEVFSEHFDKRAGEVAWEAEEQNAGVVKDQGVSLVELMMTEVAPTLMPKAVEQEFSLEFENADYELKGYIDLVTNDSEIVDLKTSSRSPSQRQVDSDLQITTYYLGYSGLYGDYPKGARMDYLVKNKTPVCKSVKTDRNTNDINKMLRLLAEVSRAIRGGHFYANPTNNLCSSRWCGYWNICPQGERSEG